MDRFAREKLLDDIRNLEQAIAAAPHVSFNVWEWLEQLPVESRIMASGPRPGCIHVEHVANGGHSGRPSTYLIGLDDSRFPHRWGQDSLLLDFERKNLTDALLTSRELIEASAHSFRQLLERLDGRVSFCYSTYSLVKDREQFPSSALLDTFRMTENCQNGSLEEFESRAGVPQSFCPTNTSQLVDTTQWWFASMAASSDTTLKSRELEIGYPHFRHSRIARESRSTAAFTPYDGYVPLAGVDLNPTLSDATRISPTRLEAFGVCPRKFLFRHGLRIAPPNQHTVDSDQWLDPLTFGSLLHEVFEEFLRELSIGNEVPQLSRDQADLLGLLHRKVDELREVVPIPNEDAYRRQLHRLEKTCEIFLRHEEEYCRTKGAVPWVFEASIGLGEPPLSDVDQPEPIPVKLSDGRVLYLGGRIDRIDRVGGSNAVDFAIWDYKSGSAWGFDLADPFKQGRKLQSYLYVEMLKHRLQADFGANARVSSFGYFFPSPRTEGLRLQWAPAELDGGDSILRTICDAIAAGAFPATSEKSDCNYCDYLPICGDPKRTANDSLTQLRVAPDDVLDSVRQLRGIQLCPREDSQE